MKPILIFAEKNDDGKVVVAKEELQRIVDEAYKRGMADANTWTTTNPITITQTWTPTWIAMTTSEPETSTIYGTMES